MALSESPAPRWSGGRAWPTAVDLFCGCGGVTAALKARHFRVVAAVDRDPVACASFRSNHRSVKVYERDIADVDPSEIRRILGERDLDLLVVCSPCQPFSQQNRSSPADTRAKLILSSVRFAEVLSPRLVLFENVPGLTRRRFALILTKLRSGLTKLGYVVGEPQELDAADYGVPQRRLRFVMLARQGAAPPPLPEPTTPAGHRIDVISAIGDLPALSSGEADADDPLHFAREHQAIALERLRHIPKNGGSRNVLPERLRLECHRDRRGHPDVYGRMRWQDIAPTLTTGCTDVTRGRFVHPRDDRAISLREAARLQTFPDTYRFAGSAKHIAAQIGNSVPIRFIEALTPVLRRALVAAGPDADTYRDADSPEQVVPLAHTLSTVTGVQGK
ncbi:MAG TPA: DNA cytosine methyltransferase [Thermoanaerobaculia bacterium]|nr:DNA cytosine methyltransferase [Thermoanaerobaculia bacterium]